MEIVQNLLVVLHLLGMGAIVGSAVFVARTTATPALVWGARAQLITGLLLVGLLEAGTEPVNHAKVGVKLLVAIAVAACAEIANARQKRGVNISSLISAAGLLTILNTAVAVLWTSPDS